MCTKSEALKILEETVKACEALFGGIQDAYLYGSYARGDYNDESDVDILLTVDMPREELTEHRRDVASVTSRLSLKYDVTVSVTVKPSEQFLRYRNVLPYYRNVVNEGIRYAV